MQTIGAIAQGESASSADGALGLAILNRLLDQWNAAKRYVYNMYHAEYAWTTSQQSYTIGQDSADFAQDRPIRIEKANLVIVSTDPDYRLPLDVYEWDEYAGIAVPAQDGSQPQLIYYRPTFPNGTIYPWPYPENDADVLANKLEIFSLVQLDSFASLGTAVDLPPGYQEAITLSLAEKLSLPFAKSVTADLRDDARKARAIMTSLNTKPLRLATRDCGIPTSPAWS